MSKAPFFFKEQLYKIKRRGKWSFCYSIQFLLISTVCTEMPRNCPRYSLAIVEMTVHLSPDCPCAQAQTPEISAEPGYLQSRKAQLSSRPQRITELSALIPKVCLLLKLLPYRLGGVGSLSKLEEQTQSSDEAVVISLTVFSYLIMLEEWQEGRWAGGRMQTVNQNDKITLEVVGWGPGSEVTYFPCENWIHQQEVKLTSFHKDTNLQSLICF